MLVPYIISEWSHCSKSSYSASERAKLTKMIYCSETGTFVCTCLTITVSMSAKVGHSWCNTRYFL